MAKLAMVRSDLEQNLSFLWLTALCMCPIYIEHGDSAHIYSTVNVKASMKMSVQVSQISEQYLPVQELIDGAMDRAWA